MTRMSPNHVLDCFRTNRELGLDAVGLELNQSYHSANRSIVNVFLLNDR
jgi:hypothetical protein